jgi:hypothetical protein
MDKNSFINETLEILEKIKHNVNKSGFMLADDALKLITVTKNTIENYSIDYSELNNEYISSLSENGFQELLYSICKIKYPELNELWFKIDGNDLSMDITYRNKIN